MGVPGELLGKQVRCPHCKQVVLAPVTAGPAPAPAAVAPPPPAPAPRPVAVVPPPAPAPVPPPPPAPEPDLPVFNIPTRKEGADSIMSEANESDDEVFGSQPGGRLAALPPLDPPPPAPPPAPAYVPPPPPQPAPEPTSGNPFAFDTGPIAIASPPPSPPRRRSRRRSRSRRPRRPRRCGSPRRLPRSRCNRSRWRRRRPRRATRSPTWNRSACRPCSFRSACAEARTGPRRAATGRRAGPIACCPGRGPAAGTGARAVGREPVRRFRRAARRPAHRDGPARAAPGARRAGAAGGRTAAPAEEARRGRRAGGEARPRGETARRHRRRERGEPRHPVCRGRVRADRDRAGGVRAVLQVRCRYRAPALHHPRQLRRVRSGLAEEGHQVPLPRGRRVAGRPARRWAGRWRSGNSRSPR